MCGTCGGPRARRPSSEKVTYRERFPLNARIAHVVAMNGKLVDDSIIREQSFDCFVTILEVDRVESSMPATVDKKLRQICH